MKVWMLFVSLLLCGSANAERLNTASTFNEVDAEEVEAYVRLHKTTSWEARRRLALQSEIGRTPSQLRREFRARLAGIYWDNGLNYRLIVRLKGEQPVPDRILALPSGQLRIVFKHGAIATTAELVQALTRHKAELRKQIPSIQATGVDERTGEVVLHVLAPGKDKSDFTRELDVARSILNLPVRIEISQLKEEDLATRLPGGGRFYYQTAECTTGFNVYAEPVHAVTTSGHCPNEGVFYINYYNADNPNYVEAKLSNALIESHDANSDFQIHPVHASSGTYVDGMFYERSTSVLTSVKSVRLYEDTELGKVVCHRGAITGYSCGEIVDLHFDPGSCPGGCNNVWINVRGDALRCDFGDSGGPVFLKSWAIAYGMVKSGQTHGPEEGDCLSMTYMPNDRLIEQGISIMN